MSEISESLTMQLSPKGSIRSFWLVVILALFVCVAGCDGEERRGRESPSQDRLQTLGRSAANASSPALERVATGGTSASGGTMANSSTAASNTGNPSRTQSNPSGYELFLRDLELQKGGNCHLSSRTELWQLQLSVRWSGDASTVFFSQRGGIFAASTDGRRVRQVVHQDPLGQDGYDVWFKHAFTPIPAFSVSPSDTRLVYSTCEYPGHLGQVFDEQPWPSAYQRQLAAKVLTERSTQRLTTDGSYANYPVFSPDGSRIAFVSARHAAERGRGFDRNAAHLYTMGMDGSQVRDLTPHLAGIQNSPPQWSPNGERLAFVARETNDAEPALLTVRADGSGSRRLADNVVSVPSWSPDGRRLAFAQLQETTIMLVTIASDGSDLQRVTTVEGTEAGIGDRSSAWIDTLAWSPAGDRILYSCGTWRMWVCVSPTDAASSKVTTLPLPPQSSSAEATGTRATAAWSPDGSRIAVALDRALGNGEVLYLVTPGGTYLQTVVRIGLDGGMVAERVQNQDAADVKAACAEGYLVPEAEVNAGLVQDCQVLAGMRDSLLGAPIISNWNQGTPLDQWAGVTVAGSPRRVEELRVTWTASSAPLPTALGDLTELRTLDLRGSGRPGPIPSQLWTLVKLEVLVLAGNELSGPIPPAIGNLAQLHALDLSSNALQGPVPPEVGQLVHLDTLVLAGNSLTGGIPADLGHLSNLTFLDISGNQLTGPIPMHLGRLSNLEVLKLGKNQFTGPIPAEFSQLVNLRELDLADNRLSGSIPAAFAGMRQLESLILAGNQFSGCIPAGIAQRRADQALGGDLQSLDLPTCEAAA